MEKLTGCASDRVRRHLYTAVIKEGTWKEVGDRLAPGGEPVRFFEMTLARVEDTTWPAAGAIDPE